MEMRNDSCSKRGTDERRGGDWRRRARRGLARRTGSDIGLERLEPRTLLAVAVDGITRHMSISSRAGLVSAPAAMVGTIAGVPTFATTTLFGYDLSFDETPFRPAGTMAVGGVGLEMRLSASTDTPITVDWTTGDTIANPRRVDLVVRAGTSSITLPHVFTQPAPDADNPPPFIQQYQVVIRGGTTAAPLETIAQVNVTATYVVQDGPDLFIRGRNSDEFPDLVLFRSDAYGTMTVSTNFESVNTDVGSSHVVVPGGAVYVDALGGADRLLAAPGFTPRLYLDGGWGDDHIVGGDAADVLRGGPGDDRIDGGRGDDRIDGSAGADRLDGGPGDDVIHGGSGADQINGEGGSDGLFGDEDDDLLQGGEGDDFLLGGLGRDTLLGEAGRDVLAGGADATPAGFPASRAIAAWQRLDARAVARLLRDRVPGPVPGSPAVINDASSDSLDGGSGRNVVAPAILPGFPANDVVTGRRPGTATIVLGDKPVATLAVQEVVGYASSSGADLVGSPTRTTYILERTYFDGNSIYPLLRFTLVSASQFTAFYGSSHPGDLLMLELDNPAYRNATPSFWAEYNEPFLQYGLDLSGVFLASSEPFDPQTLYGKTGTLSPSGMEVQYLLSHGRVYDPLRRAYVIQVPS